MGKRFAGHFDNVRDFAEVAAKNCEKMPEHDTIWAGGTLVDALRYCNDGDLSAVAHASTVADMINDSVDIAGRVDTWGTDVAGAFPCVPAYLAGDPACMWQRVDDSSTRGVLDVWFDLSVPMSITADNMRRRGVCVLSLLLALQRVRNVRAHLYTAYIFGNITIDFSFPFDVSELAAFCGQPCVSRQLCYSFGRVEDGGRVRWAAWSMVRRTFESERDHVINDYGAAAGSLIIPYGKIKQMAGLDDTGFVDYLNGVIESLNETAAA